MTDSVGDIYTGRGCIVHASYESNKQGTRIYLVGRLEDGDTFAIIMHDIRPGFYVRESEEQDALRVTTPYSLERPGRRTMDGESVSHWTYNQVTDMQRAAESLRQSGIRSYEADVRIYNQMLYDKNITGSIRIEGMCQPGRFVDRVFLDPEIAPDDWIPMLSTCSIDIENDPDTRVILSIALAYYNPFTSVKGSEVLYSGNFPASFTKPDWVESTGNERELLVRFCQRLREIDADIVTGWNVIEYDFEVISQRLEHYSIPFAAGRSDRNGVYMPGSRTQSSAVIVPGRQVVDGMRVMRSSQDRFFDHRLDTVAQSVLGEGKVDLGGPKLEAILSSYRSDPVKFCEYNCRDAQLVLDILEQSGMLHLTIRRAMLTGQTLARAWTSVAAFENLYICSMHEQGIVAPTHGVDAWQLGRAPGGAIIPPSPGVFSNVLVFDFKSLYPSIMRTFHIDPVAYLPPERIGDSFQVIEAPNGAAFRRDTALLPKILEGFFDRRERAKKAGDDAASYVYKIIMNSFYGVLGTSGCRFAASDIAGAITSFGHEFLSWCRRHFESKGYHVLYGDTDSLFVHVPEASDDVHELMTLGKNIAEDTTKHLIAYITQRWGLVSKLELEFECLYRRFFLPALRGATSASVVREVDVAALQGRAKGYAGLRYEPDADEDRNYRIEIKGMEAVRRDWTEAAKRLQRELLALVFGDSSIEEIEERTQRFIRDVKAGTLDHELIYHKALRKSVDSYTRSKPPHVKAAMMLPPADRHGVISYVWTVAGPEPIARTNSKIDYSHYLERQLKPIAEGIGDVMGVNLARLFDDDPQQELFM